MDLQPKLSEEPRQTKEGHNQPFNFVEELGVFLEDAYIFDEYYQIEVASGAPPESIAAQVCSRVGYEYIIHNEVVDNDANRLLVPLQSRRSVSIVAPPIIPYVEDELMPQELWEAVRSDDPSRSPMLTELKCVEIGVYALHTYSSGDTNKQCDIYRVDLTGEYPILYKRFPIPESEQEKRDAMGDDEDTEMMSALLDFVQPLPVWKYEQVNTSELEDLVKYIKECRDN